jgi:copper(I)-binding protein
MLMDLRAPLKAGTQVLLELVIEEKGKRTTFKTNAVVKPLTE